ANGRRDEVLLQEVERELPRLLGGRRIEGLPAWIREGVPGAGIDPDLVLDARRLERLPEGFHLLDGNGAVLRAEMPEDRHVEPGERLPVRHDLAVIDHGGIEIPGEEQSGIERPGAAEAP